ncbi:MAG: hypothetical protein QGF00_14255 [Planctomycetota bacterium]|nr:hypothetical protein [Planctomycetota bacterium]
MLLFPSMLAGEERNLARGRAHTYSPEPNYPLTTDEGDSVQLTDGLRATGDCLWTDAKAVGWSYPRGPVTVTVDLESRQPICGGSLSTAGGRAGVTFPFAVYILVSDDGKDFFPVGDLLSRSARDGLPSPVGYSAHVYRSRRMFARGRYVRFVVVPSGQFFMCDEVEVFAGTENQKDAPRGKPVTDIREWSASEKLSAIVRGRIALDLIALKKRKADSKRYGHLWDELDAMPTVRSVNWRRGLPYNDLHRRVWSAHGEVVRKRFPSPLFAWLTGQWDPLGPLDLPEKSAGRVGVEIHALNGEYRSGAFNITNLSDESQEIEILPSLDGLLIEMLKLSEVIYVEAQGRTVVANGLPAAAYTKHGWSIQVPAGSTKQLWLTAHPLSVPPRTYNCEFVLRCRKLGWSEKTPVKLVVHPFQFPEKPALAATTWDYCYPRGYIRHPDTWRNAIQQMRDHFVTVPTFGLNAVIWRGDGPRPWVDGEGSIKAHIFWGRLDEWIRHWPDARYYMLILEWRQEMPETGLKLGNPVHEKALAKYFQMLLARFARHGVSADRVIISPVDEPWQKSKSQAQVRWATLIRRACPEVLIFCNPTWQDPSEAPPALYGTADVICPNLQLYYGQGGGKKSAAGFYQSLRRQGKKLWTYQCSGPVKTLDPYSYFRLQAWHAFREGMTGIGYWALADMRHEPFGTIGSWNDFSLLGTNYSITYWDDKGVTDSKQLAAIREGIEDYEYLLMLRKAIKGKPGKKADAAQKALDRIVDEIGGGYSAGAITWRGQRDRGAADRARLQILKYLEELTR